MPSSSTNNADRPANNTRNYLSRVPPPVRSLLELPPRQQRGSRQSSRQQSGSTGASSTNVLARTDDSANGSGRGHLSRSTQPSLGSLSSNSLTNSLPTRQVVQTSSSSRTKSSTKKTIPKRKTYRAKDMHSYGSAAYESSVARTTTDSQGREVSHNRSKAGEEKYKNHVNHPLGLVNASHNNMAKTMLLLGQKHANRIPWKIDIVNDPDCKYLTRPVYGSYKDCWYNNVELVTVDIGCVLEDPITGKSFGPFINGFAVSGNLKAIADKVRTTGVKLLAGEFANGMPKSVKNLFGKLDSKHLMFFAWESEHHNFNTRFSGRGNRTSKPTGPGSSVRVPAVGYAEYSPGNSNRRVFIHPYFNAQDIDKITENAKVNKQWWPKSWDA